MFCACCDLQFLWLTDISFIMMVYLCCIYFLGSVASSAPVFAKVNFPEYMDVVTASLGTTGQECSKNIANATETLQSLLSSEEGVKKLSELFV